MARTIIAAFGRPTITNAMLWSLVFHLGVAAVSYHPWARSVDRVTLAGMRNVVQVEISLAVETPPVLDEPAVPIEFEPPPAVVERPGASPSPRESLVHVQRVPIPSAPQTAPARERSVEAPEASPSVEPFDFRRMARRQPVDTPPDPGRMTPPPLPPRELHRDQPQVSAATVQIAGVDDTLPPELLDNAPPPYPAAAIARGLQGTVLLRLHIAATGMVERVEVVNSSGHDILDSAAVEAVSRWRARPAQRAGTAVATVELLPVRFRL